MKGTRASKIDRHRRRSTSRRCWAAADRSSATDIVWELAQVLVILAKDKGDSLRVTP